MIDGDRGRGQRTLLGAGTQSPETYGSVDGAAVREALRKVTEERRQRGKSDLRSCNAAKHPLRSPEVR